MNINDRLNKLSNNAPGVENITDKVNPNKVSNAGWNENSEEIVPHASRVSNEVIPDEILRKSNSVVYEEPEEPSISTDSEKLSKEELIRLRAQQAMEKYNSVSLQEKTAHKAQPSAAAPGDDLLESLNEIEAQNAELAKNLEEAKNTGKVVAVNQETGEKVPVFADTPNEAVEETTDFFNTDDDITSLLEDIENNEIKKSLDMSDEDEAETILAKLEASKLYSSIKPNEEPTGPADYVVEKDETYAEDIESILKSNNMTIVKKSAADKYAILERFVSNGDKISMILPNSGIFVQMTGAGIDEIIAMHQMPSDSEVQNEMNKLNYISKHIVNTTVGKLKLNQLIKVISYHDIDTLYYALFAATYPDESEMRRICDKCRNEYYLKINTRDLLTNPEDFTRVSEDIKNYVTTYARLLETSKLGKLIRKVHSNGMVVYYKHPSIENYLYKIRAISDETKARYPNLVNIVFSIDKIAIHAGGGNFIEFTDPNEIVEIISRLRNDEIKYEIYDMIETVHDSMIPVYGYKPSVCPHCGSVNSMQRFAIEDLLFMQASMREEMRSMKYLAAIAKRKKMSDKK